MPTVAIWVQLQIKHPVPVRVKTSFVIFDIRALWRSGLYSCTHMATVGVKGLIYLDWRCRMHPAVPGTNHGGKGEAINSINNRHKAITGSHKSSPNAFKALVLVYRYKNIVTGHSMSTQQASIAYNTATNIPNNNTNAQQVKWHGRYMQGRF